MAKTRAADCSSEERFASNQAFQLEGSRHGGFSHPSAMIRITTDTSKGVRLLVDGHLSGLAVEELRNICAGRHHEGIVLDLSGVVFADRSAAELLKELSAAGFTLEG